MTQFSYSDLEQIWINNGGSAVFAPMAAAIAMAESGGRSDAQGTNTNGSVDRGLWQVNSSNGALSTTDINGNARAAIQISNNGTNWKPWCTAFSDGACGTKGGSFLGLGAPYQKFLSGQSTPAGNSQTQATLTADKSTSDCVLPWKLEPSLGPFHQTIGSGCLWYASWSRRVMGAFFIMGAAGLTTVGILVLVGRSPTVQAAGKQLAQQGVKAGIAAIVA